MIFDFTHNFSNIDFTKDLPECFDKFDQLWEKSRSGPEDVVSKNKFLKVRLFIELCLLSTFPVFYSTSWDWSKT